MLCVICNNITFKNTKRKEFKFFEIGFKNDTLCYLKNLNYIITSYFGIEVIITFLNHETDLKNNFMLTMD